MDLPLDSLDLRYGKLRTRRPGVERRLLASMGEGGQQSPVIVVPGPQPGRYILIDGRKRVRALKRLKADAVKAAIWTIEPLEALVAAYQMASGAGWNVLEEGFLVEELVRSGGLSLTEVGRRLERSKAWVSGRLGLVEALPGVVDGTDFGGHPMSVLGFAGGIYQAVDLEPSEGRGHELITSRALLLRAAEKIAFFIRNQVAFISHLKTSLWQCSKTFRNRQTA